jgi:DNA replication protein DnaC
MAEDPIKAVLHYAQALKAPRIRDSAARLAEQARDASWTHEEYLAAVLSREVAAREASGAATRIRSAGFPTRKSLEDFNFDHQPALNRDMIAHLGTGAFLAKARNVVLLGPGVIEGSGAEWQRLPCSGRCCDRCNVGRGVDAAAGQFAS